MDKKQITAIVLIGLSKAFVILFHSTLQKNSLIWEPRTKLCYGFKATLPIDNSAHALQQCYQNL